MNAIIKMEMSLGQAQFISRSSPQRKGSLAPRNDALALAQMDSGKVIKGQAAIQRSLSFILCP